MNLCLFSSDGSLSELSNPSNYSGSFKDTYTVPSQVYNQTLQPEAEFKEFEPRLKFKPMFKYGWFHLKLYSIFLDLSRRLIETGF